MLSAAIQDYHHDWEEHLRATCMAFNTSEQVTIKFATFFHMFGRPPVETEELVGEGIQYSSITSSNHSTTHR